MGFVEKLWDETVAGPSPETFRKVQVDNNNNNMNVLLLRPIRSTPPVSRSITLLRTRSLPVAPPPAASASALGGSDPSPPSSPLTPGTPSDELRRLSRTHTPTSLEEAIPHPDFTSSPPVYRF